MAHIHCVIFIVIEMIFKKGYVILFHIHLCTNLDLLIILKLFSGTEHNRHFWKLKFHSFVPSTEKKDYIYD